MFLNDKKYIIIFHSEAGANRMKRFTSR